VGSQQPAHLTSFQSSIYFSDDRIQTVTTWEAFDTFVDNSTSTVTGVDLVWVFLVQFPGRPTPEKESIAITIDTGRMKKKIQQIRNDSVTRYLAILLLDQDPEIKVKIDYTEMTWGIDVLNHINNEITRALIDEWWPLRAIRAAASLTLIFMIPAIILMPVGLYQWFQNSYKDVARDNFLSSIAKENNLQLEVIKRLDYLINDQVGSPFSDISYWIYIFASLLLFASLFLIVMNKTQSYLLLNTAAVKSKLSQERIRERLKASVFVCILLGVIAEVLGAQVSELIKKFL
jgi:hypothetical protein